MSIQSLGHGFASHFNVSSSQKVVLHKVFEFLCCSLVLNKNKDSVILRIKIDKSNKRPPSDKRPSPNQRSPLTLENEISAPGATLSSRGTQLVIVHSLHPRGNNITPTDIKVFYDITSSNEDPLFIGLLHCTFSVSRRPTKVPAGKENKCVGE